MMTTDTFEKALDLLDSGYTFPSITEETGITTAMVFVFAAAASIFFLLADQVIRMAVTLVLRIAGSF